MTLEEYARKQGLVDGTGCLTPHALRVVGQNIIRLIAQRLDDERLRLLEAYALELDAEDRFGQELEDRTKFVSFEHLGELLRGRHQARIFRRRLRHKMIRRDWGPEMLETPQPRLGKTWRETVRYLLHA